MTTTYKSAARFGATPEFAYLRSEASAAHSLYIARYNDRVDGIAGPASNRIKPAVAGMLDQADTSVLAQLARIAWAEAEAADITGLVDPSATFQVAEKLQAAQDEIDPQERPSLVTQTDVCSHGRLFSDDCAECDSW